MADIEDDQSNDFEDEEVTEDDEATIDEEDALNDTVDYADELKQLNEEGEMSLEELRRKYYGSNNDDADSNGNKANDLHVDKEEEDKDDVDDGDGTDVLEPSSSTTTTTRNLRGKIINVIQAATESSTQYFKPEDLEEDDSDDYMPPDIWKKEVRVGPDFQVNNIPELMRTKRRKDEADNCICAPNEISEVLWLAAPARCPEQDIINYLMECEQVRAGEKLKHNRTAQRRGAAAKTTNLSSMLSTSSETVPDDENALLALYQADYDVNKAKAKAPFEWPALCSANGPRLTQPEGPWRTWMEQDCIDFERGLHEHGKQFWKIQRDFLPNRTIGEIVCFYYCWKKSERYDMWMAEKCRREQQIDAKTSDLMGHIVHSILHEDIQIPPPPPQQQQQQDPGGGSTKQIVAIDVNGTADQQ